MPLNTYIAISKESQHREQEHMIQDEQVTNMLQCDNHVSEKQSVLLD